MDALQIGKAILGGFDWGARTADIIAALWPERCKALVSLSGYLISSQKAGKVPLPPQAELQWWYQYYFATERGRAGYDKYRHDFAKLIWQLASPKWHFDDTTFDRGGLSGLSQSRPQRVLLYFSHSVAWKLFDEINVFRNFESGNLRFQGADHLCFVKVRIRLWDDRSDDSFPEIIVSYANNRTFHDPLHFLEITFNFFRVYVVAAGDDQILAAPDQGQISLGHVFHSRTATESA
jgi:pimeloyl-ACP methyl ester carboxylesterase